MSETIHNKFIAYLKANTNLAAGGDAESIVEFAETELPRFIRKHFRKNFGGIYDETNHDYYLKLKNEYYINSAAKDEDNANGRKYTNALIAYEKFLDSKAFRGRANKATLTEAEKKEMKEKKKNRSSKTAQAEPKEMLDPMMPKDDEGGKLTEGRIHQVHVTKHERNRSLRQICLQHYGYVCQVCKIDFEKVYGEPGKQFIEVHHLNPIADTDGEHALDPVEGLVPLCSNCHSMIHRKPGGQPYTLQELRNLYKVPTWDKIEEKMKD